MTDDRLLVADLPVDELVKVLDEKGVGPVSLFASIHDPPDGLKSHHIKVCLHKTAKYISRCYWQAMQDAAVAHPGIMRVDLTESFGPGSPSRVEWLRAQMEKKRIFARALFNVIKESSGGKDLGWDWETIQSWIRKERAIRSASWESWITVKLAIRNINRSCYLERKGRLDLAAPGNPFMQGRTSWIKRTVSTYKIKPSEIFAAMENRPDNLTNKICENIITGKTTSALWSHWNAIEPAVKALAGRKLGPKATPKEAHSAYHFSA